MIDQSFELQDELASEIRHAIGAVISQRRYRGYVSTVDIDTLTDILDSACEKAVVEIIGDYE